MRQIERQKPTQLIRIPYTLYLSIKEQSEKEGFNSMVAYLTHLIKNDAKSTKIDVESQGKGD